MEALLKLLETEQDENVLTNIFISLANVDDPKIIPQFTETTRKLKLATVYIGIRSISALRPTDTRQEMISTLQSLEVSLESSSGTSDGVDTDSYHGKPLQRSNVEVLIELERLIGEQIPIVIKMDRWTFGAVVESSQVVELGLASKRLMELPENIGQLTGLRVLWLSDNQIKSLPESFGNLRALRRLLAEGNEITSLPDSIVNLKNLEFVRLDEKVKTTTSEKAAKWLEETRKRLAPRGSFLWN
jgi:Leucine-rich repeat (LRR) protein